MTKTKKENQSSLGLLLAVFATLFLWNPNVNIIDFLPDWIGYILLCTAITKLAWLNESIESALRSFRTMIFVDMGKWLAILWVFGLNVLSERNSSLLLWAFVFAVAELIVLIPAYTKLFSGLIELGYFYPNTAIFGKANQEKTPTDKIRRATVVFVAIKAVLSVLPEFSDLTNASYDESSAFFNIYQHIGTMRMLSFAAVFVAGVIWAIRMIRYWIRVRQDTALMSGLYEKYITQVAPKTGQFVKRNFDVVYLLTLVALCLTVDLRMDNQNLLPDFLAAVAFTVVFIMLRKRTAIFAAPWIVGCSVYFGVSLAAAVAEYRFFAEYWYSSIWRNEEAMRSYWLFVILDILKILAFLVLLFILLRAFFRVVETHTGYVAGKTQLGEREQSMVLSLQKDLKVSLIVAYVFAVLYGASEIAYDLLARYYGFMGLLVLCFALSCIGMFIRALTPIKQAIDTKYMLD